MKKQIKTVIGGTFEELHAGHIKLISIAFHIGDYVVIGLTSDKFAIKTRNREVLPYKERKRRLERLISASKWNKDYEIVEINDPYGPTIKERDLHIIVVSIETFEGALKINYYRERKKMPPLLIHVIDLVETSIGDKISSTSIKKKIQDVWGRS
jgi:pantetheine-phosphate adenylyltransferase